MRLTPTARILTRSLTLFHVLSVIKSRLQAGSAEAQRYKSALDGLMTVIREEGIEGLYKGVGSKLTQSVLTAAILFACQRRIYETIKRVTIRHIVHLFGASSMPPSAHSHSVARGARLAANRRCFTSLIKY